MADHLKTQLKLNPKRIEKLILNTFGSNNFSKKKCDIIEVRLQGKQGSTVIIIALSFPIICAALPSLHS